MLRSSAVPGSIIVVGAGAVGVEFASYYHDLGSEVTVLEYLPGMVPLEDAEISAEMERAFKRRGIRVVTSARFDPASVSVDESGVRLMVGREGEAPAELRAEQLLVATGRAANTEDVGLETTRAVVEKGLVKVDGHMRTADPHLYAIGDIIGGLWLAHVAAHEGIAAVHAIAGREVEPVDYVKMPRATYARPQIASIGLTSAQCEAAGRATRVGKFPFQASGKAIINGDTSGFVKVIADARDGRGPGRAHDRRARHGAHRGGLRGHAAGGHGLGGRLRRPPAPDPLRGPGRGGPGGGRQVHQLLGAWRGPARQAGRRAGGPRRRVTARPAPATSFLDRSPSRRPWAPFGTRPPRSRGSRAVTGRGSRDLVARG